MFWCVCIAIGLLIVLALNHKTLYKQYMDPSGRYKAMITYKTYLSLLPMPIGSSSDKPGYVKIVDENGNNLGEIPVPMLQMAEVEWTAEGAEVRLIGEWNFSNNLCYYWDETGNRRIYVKGKP